MLLLALLAPACGTSPDSADETGDIATDLRTLDTCATTLADDVPSFYSSYFRCIDASMDGDDVLLTTSNLPPHPSAYYNDDDPNHEAWDDRGGDYVQNPNRLTEQLFQVRIPTNPVPKGLVVTAAMHDLTAGTSREEYPMGHAGVALDGVSLYNAVAGPGMDIREEKYTFDSWEGHPSPDGAYHHHSPNSASLAVLAHLGAGALELFGIMCDGTVVLGCTELDGSAPGLSDADAQQGHLHDLTDAAGTTHFLDRYHIHMCAALEPDAFTPEIQYYEACGVVGGGPP